METPSHQLPPLTGSRLYLLTFALGMIAFIDMLDFSVANVAIPSIAAMFGISSQEGTWVITLYAVTNCITLALTGRLAQRLGSVRLTLLTTLLFTIASFLCGMAWSFTSLLFFRMLQGIVGGPLSSISQSVMLSQCAGEKKNLVSGIFFICLIVPVFLGPVIGGWITENYGWRWIFFVNVPFGILSCLISWVVLKDRIDPATLKTPLDWIGFLLLASTLTLFQIFLDQGHHQDWFNSNYIRFLAIIVPILLINFLIWNGYASQPLIDFSFFRDRNFLTATCVSCVPFFVASASTIIMPLWLQTYMGYTPLLSGWALMPLGILPLFMTPLVGGFFMQYRCLRALIAFGCLVFAITSFWQSALTTQVSLSQIMLIRLFQGLGISFCFLPLFQLAVMYIDEKSLTRATGVYNFIRLTLSGAGASTAISITLWEHRAAIYHVNLAEVMHPLHQTTVHAYQALESAGIQGVQVAQIFDHLIMQQAFLLSFNDLNWMAGWISLGVIPFIWLCKEPLERRKTVLAME